MQTCCTAEQDNHSRSFHSEGVQLKGYIIVHSNSVILLVHEFSSSCSGFGDFLHALWGGFLSIALC